MAVSACDGRCMDVLGKASIAATPHSAQLQIVDSLVGWMLKASKISLFEGHLLTNSRAEGRRGRGGMRWARAGMAKGRAQREGGGGLVGGWCDGAKDGPRPHFNQHPSAILFAKDSCTAAPSCNDEPETFFLHAFFLFWTSGCCCHPYLYYIHSLSCSVLPAHLASFRWPGPALMWYCSCLRCAVWTLAPSFVNKLTSFQRGSND